ncbi:hypothetical protein H6G11_04160 [Cyanobacterium aponinum FACHB-4101]|uniref:hypothetical protein n=1 Tax=Cyanobacterium aponinum TaxID=379064 RepID=UPI001680140F|nr:hypothetical protein [Cyanobacterium aponinum]MBD2393446.1 hypothetical protein [Cyanobacterium aponinum FACHB-4101]
MKWWASPNRNTPYWLLYQSHSISYVLSKVIIALLQENYCLSPTHIDQVMLNNEYK